VKGHGVLFLYHRPTMRRLVGDASNVSENIAAFPRLSRFPVHTVNTALGPPPKLDELEFDAIVVHYSVYVSGPTPYFIEGFEDYLRASDAYKIATFQDEHHWCGKRFGFIDEYGIDCVFTMLEQPYADEVYLSHTTAKRTVTNLPGYVGPELLDEARKYTKPEADRGIDIGYRGRLISVYMGRGGLEKYEIGRRFKDRAANSGLVLDIEVEETDRLYGDDWYRFMADCKAVLGTESGVSCFDLEDEVVAEYTRLAAGGREPAIEELEAGALGRWEGKIPYRTISPRHFEAAALRVTQILFEGHYSGAMEPGRHYIELRKDFSNYDEVIERFGNAELRRELTDNAYDDLIASGDYGYEKLIESFDQVLHDAGLDPDHAAAGTDLVKKGLHRPLVRRTGFYATGLWGALAHRAPKLWRVLHVASRPVVAPIRWAQQRSRGAS
jgi:hypothetical protein